MNLSNLLEENKFDTSSYGTVCEQQMTFDDNVYALPFRTNDWVLFYNKNLFDKAGIAYPTDQMTWQDVGKLAKEVTEKSADGVYGYSFQPKVGFIFPMLAGTMNRLISPRQVFPVLQPRWIGFWICRKVEQWRDVRSQFSMNKIRHIFITESGR